MLSIIIHVGWPGVTGLHIGLCTVSILFGSGHWPGSLKKPIFEDIFFFADHLSKEGDDQRQEAAEERHKAVQLDYHAEHRPAQQHRHDSAQEGRGSLQTIPLREKGEGLVQSQTAGKS
jgi:hypothetical protein